MERFQGKKKQKLEKRVNLHQDGLSQTFHCVKRMHNVTIDHDIRFPGCLIVAEWSCPLSTFWKT